jgi:hypothetical protein
MSFNKNTVPQVLYDTPNPLPNISELYKIDGVVLETATDPAKCWVIREEHGYWDEKEKKFLHRATTLQPNEEKYCLSIHDAWKEIEKQIMRRVKEGFKYQFEWDPYDSPFYKRYEILEDGTKLEY